MLVYKGRSERNDIKMENVQEEDLLLVRKAKKGDAQAYGELIKFHKEYLYRTAFSYVKNQDLALDVLQETTVQGLLAIHSLREPKYFKTWITRILYNCAMQMYRKSSKVIPYAQDELPKAAEMLVESGISQEEKMDLHDAVSQLDEPYRTLIVLKYFEGLTISEISKMSSRPEGTIKSDLSKAKKKLRTILREGYIYA